MPSPATPPDEPAAPGPAARLPSGFISIAAVSGSRFLSQGLTVVIGILSAAYFGAGVAKDSYVVAQTIPSLIGSILIGGLYSLLVVRLTDIGAQEGLGGQRRLLRRTLLQTVLVLAPIVALSAIFPRVVIGLVAPGFGAEQLELAGHLLVLAMLTMVGTVLFHLIRAMHNADQQFVMPSLFTVLVGLLTLVTLLALVKDTGIYALALGPLAGSAAGVIGLWLATGRLAPPPSVAGTDRVATQPRKTAGVWRDFLPMSVGANFGQVNLLVNNAFASFLPTGSITRLGFASVISSNAELITIFSLAEVAFPRFSLAAGRGLAALNEELRLQMRYMLLLTAPIACGCVTFGTPLARLLFERGAFDAASTDEVARTIGCYAPEILFMGYFALFWRVHMALRKSRIIVWTSVGAMALNGVLVAVLMKPFGIGGIALATSGVTTAFAIVLARLLRAEGIAIMPPEELRFTLKVVLAAAIMGGAIMAWTAFAERSFDVGREIVRMAEVGGGLALAGLVYSLSLHLLRVREVHEALGRVLRLVAPRVRR